jgi:hypothetical protein
MIEQSRLSTRYVHAAITATTYAGAPIDPATLQVQLAVVPVGAEPAGADWHDAAHLGGDVFGVLVGPNGGVLDLPRGDYDTWHHIADNPEDEREPFGKLRIT